MLRLLGGDIPMKLTITALTEDRVTCGPWFLIVLPGQRSTTISIGVRRRK